LKNSDLGVLCSEKRQGPLNNTRQGDYQIIAQTSGLGKTYALFPGSGHTNASVLVILADGAKDVQHSGRGVARPGTVLYAARNEIRIP